MITLKKLIFAPVFLVFFTLLIYQLSLNLSSYGLVIILSVTGLINLIALCFLVFLSGTLFVIFATLAADWKISLPVGIFCSFIPMLFFPPALALIFAVGILASFLLSFLSLDISLKSYLNFQPFTVLGPSIRRLSGLLILSFCIIYFLSMNKIIAQNGFEVPDSLIDTALKISPISLPEQSNSTITQLPAINPKEIEELKKNPGLLEQYGLDPKILDNINISSQTPKLPAIANKTIKQTTKDIIQNFVEPYLPFIPAILAAILFLSLYSLTSMINLLAYPLLLLIFYILEKTGFTKFTTEMRPVKKLVIE